MLVGLDGDKGGILVLLQKQHHKSTFTQNIKNAPESGDQKE